jgi:E3 ubiquitin-protein ligase DOA10
MGFVEELGPSIAEQDEDQVALCKICFSEGGDDCPLLHEVCGCKGSLDAVHGR